MEKLEQAFLKVIGWEQVIWAALAGLLAVVLVTLVKASMNLAVRPARGSRKRRQQPLYVRSAFWRVLFPWLPLLFGAGVGAVLGAAGLLPMVLAPMFGACAAFVGDRVWKNIHDHPEVIEALKRCVGRGKRE